MMERLAARGGQLARSAQEQRVQEVAQQLRTIFGSAAVEVQEARVLVRGRGSISHRLIIPRPRTSTRAG